MNCTGCWWVDGVESEEVTVMVVEGLDGGAVHVEDVVVLLLLATPEGC